MGFVVVKRMLNFKNGQHQELFLPAFSPDVTSPSSLPITPLFCIIPPHSQPIWNSAACRLRPDLGHRAASVRFCSSFPETASKDDNNTIDCMALLWELNERTHMQTYLESYLAYGKVIGEILFNSRKTRRKSQKPHFWPAESQLELRESWQTLEYPKPLIHWNKREK